MISPCWTWFTNRQQFIGNGTSLHEGDFPKVELWDMVRMIATARIIMPASMIRLSAGRAEMNEED